jgi:hypothetical protein
MKTLLSLGLLINLVCLAASQTVLQGRIQPQAGDMSLHSAAVRAKNFLSLLNISAGDVSQYKGMLTKQYGARSGRRKWLIYTDSTRISVDSQSGLVTLYVNATRQDDRYRGKGRTGAKFTTSESVAKSHLRTIATRLGVPTSTQMTGYDMKGDGVGNDSNPMGRFGCVFKNSAGEVVATLACDLQDGVVLEYSRSR